MSFNQGKRGRIGTTTRLFVAFTALVASGAFIGISSMGASRAVHHKTVTLRFINAYNDVTEIPDFGWRGHSSFLRLRTQVSK